MMIRIISNIQSWNIISTLYVVCNPNHKSVSQKCSENSRWTSSQPVTMWHIVSLTIHSFHRMFLKLYKKGKFFGHTSFPANSKCEHNLHFRVFRTATSSVCPAPVFIHHDGITRTSKCFEFGVHGQLWNCVDSLDWKRFWEDCTPLSSLKLCQYCQLIPPHTLPEPHMLSPNALWRY